MNAFRLIGDMLHLLSIVLLLVKLHISKNCLGISCKMQELYLIVFITRYLDLFAYFVSYYNSIMKIVFILATAYTIYVIKYFPHVSQTYSKKLDKFPYEKYLLGPAAVLALLTTSRYTFLDVMWTYSIWLESVAIVPQLVMLYQQREVENMTSHYVVTMGLYRCFYILNWVYRYFYEKPPYVNVVSWIGGLIQTVLYLDFFYYYAMSKWYGKRLVLPVTVPTATHSTQD